MRLVATCRLVVIDGHRTPQQFAEDRHVHPLSGGIAPMKRVWPDQPQVVSRLEAHSLHRSEISMTTDSSVLCRIHRIRRVA